MFLHHKAWKPYDAQLSKAETVNGKSYAISHQATNLGGFPVHIVGFNDSLDRKREEGGYTLVNSVTPFFDSLEHVTIDTGPV